MARRLKTRTETRGSRPGSVIVALLLVVSLLLGVGWLNGVAASSSGSIPEASSLTFQAADLPGERESRNIRVYDRANLLTDSQKASIRTDLGRAASLGIEILVYTRISGDAEAESQAYADRLGSEWEVESAPGANDGLVYLITVVPSNPELNSIVISAGENVLPIRQLDQAALRRMLETDMAPEVADGEFYTAILFGVRRVLNFAEYSPPSPEQRSPSQESLNTAAGILGAALAQFAVLGFFAVPAIREGRLTLTPSPRSLAAYAVALGVASVVVGIVAIAGRSPFSSLLALATLVVASCVIPLVIGLQSRRAQRDRTIHVSGRPRAIGHSNG